MPGRNVFHEDSLTRRATLSQGQSCVFISHSHLDETDARMIDAQLRSANVNTYFAPNDAATRVAAATGSAEILARRIETALSDCTHLLGLITPNARATSWWVPYEIGSARGRSRSIAHIVHAGITQVPEFLTLGTVIWDVLDLRKWVTALKPALLSETIRRDAISESVMAGMLPGYRAASYGPNP